MVETGKIPEASAGKAEPSHVIEDASQAVRAKQLLRSLWLASVLVVIIGSLLPSDSLPIRTLEHLPLSDKIEHVMLYAVLTFLPTIHERRKHVIAIALGAIALGIGLEYAQLFTGWREFEIGDMVADAVGVCLGIAAAIPMRLIVREAGWIKA